jgi:Holliday junction resolvasome RuvABC endonuclease subunit
MGIRHVTANRKTVAKHVTGFGNGNKDQMLMHVREEWPECKGHDEADAYALARWGFDNYANFANLGL